MKQTTLRGGLAGCGTIANISHLPALRAAKGVEIVAACDIREEAVKETAKRWRIPGIHTDFSRMLQSEELNFVDICTAPPTHCQLAIQAMKAGLHVLVEKPMAVNTNEADRMLSAAREQGIKLCVVHNNLFSPVVQKARTLVNNKAIGELIAVEIHLIDKMARHLSKKDAWYHGFPGGVFGEYAPHPTYLAQAFLGNIHSVRAIALKCSKTPGAAADELRVLLEAEKGLGIITVSCNSPRDSFTLDISGTKGILHLDNLAMTMTHSRYRGTRVHELILDQLSSGFHLLAGAVSNSIKALFGQRYYKAGHRVLIQKFAESIRDNIDPPVSGEDDRETIRILEDIWKQISQPEGSIEGQSL